MDCNYLIGFHLAEHGNLVRGGFLQWLTTATSDLND